MRRSGAPVQSAYRVQSLGQQGPSKKTRWITVAEHSAGAGTLTAGPTLRDILLESQK